MTTKYLDRKIIKNEVRHTERWAWGWRCLDWESMIRDFRASGEISYYDDVKKVSNWDSCRSAFSCPLEIKYAANCFDEKNEKK